MNKIFILDLYKNALLTKLSNKVPSIFLKEIEKNDYLQDIHHIIANNKIHYICEGNSSCFLLKHKNTIFICPNSKINLQINDKLIFINESVKVHKGLFTEYEKIKTGIIKHINKLSENNDIVHIYISGHSIGAGLASLIAYDIIQKFKYYYNISCFLYDSPKVGNSEFYKQLKIGVNCIYDMILKNEKQFDKILIEEDNISYIAGTKYFNHLKFFKNMFYNFEFNPNDIDMFISRLKNILQLSNKV